MSATSGGSSRSFAVAGLTGFVKAIHLLSGLNIGVPSTPGIWNASPPASFMRKNQVDSSTGPAEVMARRLEVNARRRPSGLHLGAVELKAGLVRRRGSALPSAGAAQISLWRRFSLSTMKVRTN